MDYPKKTLRVGLVDGKFIDENPATGLVGSLIPATWGNAVTDEVLAVINAAGIVPSEDDSAQLLKAIQGIAASDVKRSVRVATTGPIALSGLQTIDSVQLAVGDRVLVKNQAAAAQNWIYIVAVGSWTRALDANEDSECTPGHLIIVQSGTAYANSLWQLTNTTPPLVGTTGLEFGQLFGKTGVTAGIYRQVTVDAQGRVTAGGNPTTLGGYNILDAYTKPQVDLLLADPWAFQPIGVPIPVFDGASAGLPPPKGKSYRYIRLTAGDTYNDDLLTGEVVAGSAPLLSAYATISLAGSLLTGSRVWLINTERRFLRAGQTGTVENDQLQGFTMPAGTASGTNGPVFDSWGNGTVNTTKIPLVTDSVNGTPRTGAETRPKNVGATYYMRIL